MKKINTARLKRKFLRGTKGVISLFLAILMVPFVSIAAMLVNAGRVNSAVAIFDEALCNASNSTLGTYDEFLRERFALMAMNQNTSDGGTKYGTYSADYSADELINDIFNYYMEKNVGTLSNTYVTTEVSGDGLYPLSDNSVLLSSVLQSSKITVPAKLATDWGSFDDMLKELTKGFDLLSDIEGLATSGCNVATSISELTECEDDLIKLIEECDKKKDDYDDAYDNFKKAADEFNDLVDKAKTAADEVETCQDDVDDLSTKIDNLNKDLIKKEEEHKKLEDTENDNTDEIEKLNKEIDELKEKIDNKKDEKEDANKDLNDAKDDLNEYSDQFNTKRTAVVNTKNKYYDTIVALRDVFVDTSDKAVDFQNKAEKVVNGAEGLISNSITVGFSMAKDNNEKTSDKLKSENEEYAKQKQKAEEDGNSSAAAKYRNKIEENDSAISDLRDDKTQIGNADTVKDATVNSMKTANETMTGFANDDLLGKYSTINTKLYNLLDTVTKISVPDDYTKISYSGAYPSINNPLSREYVTEIIDSIEDSIVNNVGWTCVKAVVGFLKALFTIATDFDPELQSHINTSLYSSNGGLPSKINRTVHPITSEFEEEDEEQSDAYKNLLNSFSTDDVYDTTGDSQSLFEKIQNEIEKLTGYFDEFKLSKLPAIATSVSRLFGYITGNQITNILKDGAVSMGKKMLLVGYISYNTANRTTYSSGKALTGASYNLPDASENIGYAFSGAEMEYIFNGSMSEESNQRTVFQFLWIERVLLNIAPIAKDPTVLQLATDLGAVTYGIGGVLVYAAYFLAESFIDTVILANGGEIPMAKSYVFLTPNGLPKLVEKIFKLSLKESENKKIYNETKKCFEEMDSGVSIESYDDAKAREQGDSGDSEDSESLESKILNLFNWDYTKSTQILLLLFRNTNTLLSRLADIIQMESTYNAKSKSATYNFNLDKSYTYLRASGNFSTNMFIKIGTRDSLTSQKRVVYNGY